MPHVRSTTRSVVGFRPHAPKAAFSDLEWKQLLRYGRALSDLVAGARAPATAAQERFVEFACVGARPPETDLELLWCRYLSVRSTPLTVELVPASSWFNNCRSMLPQSTWDRLRKVCYRAARYRCDVCGGRGADHPVEAHEVWHYDEQERVQRLVGLTALCPQCHKVKHMGKASSEGGYGPALSHLARVNGWTEADAATYVEVAFEQWMRRSGHAWEVDLSWLYGVHVRPEDVLGSGPETLKPT